MKTWKLVAGIISVVLFCVVMLQSCSVSVYNTISDNTNDFGGIAGFTVGFLMLAGGIISIVTHKTVTKGNKIALLVLFGLAAGIALNNAGVYKNLIIWGIWCAINALIALLAGITEFD